MDGRNEQRVAIKFCFKASLSVTETLVLVQKDYGNETLNWSNVFRWYSRFRDGRELIGDYQRGGHPKSTRTEVNIAAVAELVKNDCWIASRMIAEFLNIPKTVVLQILREDLGKRKLCACFVPRPWHLNKRKIESQIAKTLSWWPMQTKFFLTKLLLEMRPGVLPVTPKQSEFWMGWWDIPSAKETEIPKVPHQDHVDNIFRLSRHSAQRIRTRGKDCKCRILWRSNGLPPEVHSSGVSSCVLLSRLFLVAQ